MYRIGEFSKLTNISVKTLRYYNEIGLLIPEEVDIYSNYRYYGKRNIEEIKIITKLKSVGFSLEEIKNNWNNFTDEVYKQKQIELEKELGNLSEKIKLLEIKLNNLERRLDMKKNNFNF